MVTRRKPGPRPETSFEYQDGAHWQEMTGDKDIRVRNLVSIGNYKSFKIVAEVGRHMHLTINE